MAAPKTLLALYGVSSRILINGAEGIVVGGGTRSSARKRSLSLSAGMYQMDTSLVEATDPGAGAWNTVAFGRSRCLRGGATGPPGLAAGPPGRPRDRRGGTP